MNKRNLVRIVAVLFAGLTVYTNIRNAKLAAKYIIKAFLEDE